MSYRSVKSVPAFVAGIVAATNLATVTDLRAQSAEPSTQVAQAATDSCLSSPKGATPAGSHWYYRIDRTTKRQCWYLREENDKADDKFARAAPPASAPAPSSAAAEPPQPAARKSVSDARAEWVSQPPRAEPAKADPRTTGTVLAENSPRAAMPNVLAPSPLSSMRWNDAPTAASVSTTPAAVQVAAAAPATTQPAPAEEVQQPAVDQITPAPAEPVTTAKPTASLQMLLLVIAAALALAGLIVSAMVRIGRMRARRAMRTKRRKMWDSARTRRTPQPSPQPMLQDEDARPRRPAAAVHNTRAPQERAARVPQERAARVPRERPRAPQERSYAPQERARVPQERRPAPQDRDREQQMTEMLARLARSAQT